MTSQPFTYRLINPHELPEFYEKRYEFQMEMADQDLKDQREYLTKENFVEECLKIEKESPVKHNYTHFGAFLDDRITAIASVHKVQMLPRPNKLNDYYGYLTTIYTTPSHRGQGIMTQLLEYIKSWATNEDLEFLMVWPSDPSIQFYKKLGYIDENQPLILKLREY